MEMQCQNFSLTHCALFNGNLIIPCKYLSSPSVPSYPLLSILPAIAGHIPAEGLMVSYEWTLYQILRLDWISYTAVHLHLFETLWGVD